MPIKAKINRSSAIRMAKAPCIVMSLTVNALRLHFAQKSAVLRAAESSPAVPSSFLWSFMCFSASAQRCSLVAKQTAKAGESVDRAYEK